MIRDCDLKVKFNFNIPQKSKIPLFHEFPEWNSTFQPQTNHNLQLKS